MTSADAAHAVCCTLLSSSQVPAGSRLPAVPDLDPWVVEAVSARRCLPLLAPLVHVPALYAMELQDLAQSGSGSIASPQAVKVSGLAGSLCQAASALTSCQGCS